MGTLGIYSRRWLFEPRIPFSILQAGGIIIRRNVHLQDTGSPHSLTITCVRSSALYLGTDEFAVLQALHMDIGKTLIPLFVGIQRASRDGGLVDHDEILEAASIYEAIVDS